MPLFLLLLIVGVGLICLGKYVATPPLAAWCFGSGVFCCAVALILFLYVVLTSGGLTVA